jgi:hypothetical protein
VHGALGFVHPAFGSQFFRSLGFQFLPNLKALLGAALLDFVDRAAAPEHRDKNGGDDDKRGGDAKKGNDGIRRAGSGFGRHISC